MIVKFVLQHGMQEEPVEITKEVQAVPREGEQIVAELEGLDETAFIVDTVQHLLGETVQIVIYATDTQG